MQGRTAEGYRTATRALALVDPAAEASGPAHFAVGGSAVSLGRPAEALRHLELAAQLASGAPSLSIGTRPDVHGQAFAAHAHWLLGHDDEALASCRGAIALARAIDDPYNLAVALAYAAITHQLRGDLAGAAGRRRRAARAVRAVRLRLLPRVGADPGRLVAPGRVGHRPGPAAASTTCEAAGSFARMPYWLSLLADLCARDGQAGAARATLDAALAAGAGARRPVVAARGDADAGRATTTTQAAVARLRAAAELAAAQGSVALLRRCERDLAERGVPRPASVRPAA